VNGLCVKLPWSSPQVKVLQPSVCVRACPEQPVTLLLVVEDLKVKFVARTRVSTMGKPASHPDSNDRAFDRRQRVRYPNLGTSNT